MDFLPLCDFPRDTGYSRRLPWKREFCKAAVFRPDLLSASHSLQPLGTQTKFMLHGRQCLDEEEISASNLQWQVCHHQNMEEGFPQLSRGAHLPEPFCHHQWGETPSSSASLSGQNWTINFQMGNGYLATYIRWMINVTCMVEHHWW